MENAYFINTPLYGDLIVEEVLFSYDNTPIIFTCKNKNSIRCLCVCDDIIKNQSWIITKINSKVLLDVLHDRISICKAFELSDDVTTIAERVNGEIKYFTKSYKDIDPMELPDPNEKLEMVEELYSYITLIEFENLCLSLFIDPKENDNYSFTIDIKSTVSTTTTSAIFDTLNYSESFDLWDNISINYSSQDTFDFEPLESPNSALESDVNLLNAA